MSDAVIDLPLTSSDKKLPGWGAAIQGFAAPDDTTTSGSLYFGNHVSPWVFEAAKKLDAMACLQHGWDSYGGLPLKRDAKRLTVDLLGWLKMLPLPVPAVILGSGGTVHLEWRSGGKELEVELGEGRRLDFVTVSPDGRIDEGSAKSQLPAKVRDLTSWLMEG